jgi:FkbM family methyltransferase
MLGPATASSVGRISRRTFANGWLGWRSAGAVKRLLPSVLRTGTVVYRDASGHLVEADLSDRIERAGFLGAHDPALLRALGSYLTPGDWAIDVGANVGLVTSRMCALVGPTGAVWSFEPLPVNVRKLEDFKARNGLDQLKVFPVALSSEATTAALRLPVGSGGNAYGTFVPAWEAGSEVAVPTRRLDDVVAADGDGRRVRLLKIDAEGAEPAVIDGAAGVLTEMRPVVVCELNEFLLRRAGTSSEALLARFADLGYASTRHLGRRRQSLMRSVDVVLEQR